MTKLDEKVTEIYPMVPIRDVVVFPYMMVPFVIGRQSSVLALERALESDKKIYLATQIDASMDNPTPDDIYPVGTAANIVQSLKLPDGNIKVLVEGLRRARAVRVVEVDGFFQAEVKFDPVTKVSPSKLSLLTKRLNTLFEEFAKLNPNINDETIIQAAHSSEADRLADTIAANLPISVEDKQSLLEIADPAKRIEKICEFIDIEIDKVKMDKSLQGRVRRQMEKAQREYYLSEKMKAIQKELGRNEKDEIEQLKKKVKEAKMPKDAHEKATNEIQRLEQMPPMSAETTVSRTYIDWLVSMPWSKKSREIKDLLRAERTLNQDHYGLEKVKERILEFLAVRQLSAKTQQGSVLCFVGAPGVGKSSLGSSIARATGRKFVRLSLGGVRDEAEIRGHRRTYIGALPGQIIQMMKKAGTKNPVFLIDEVDKMSMDFRGDPSAALMEVLDPEHNRTFVDHYLDTEFDLSNVMFICTANVLHTIPRPLQDRMEVVHISGYTEWEKLSIATQYLVKKQLKQQGLKPSYIEFSEEGIQEIIRSYTRESGVRNLEREIANVCRKVARQVVVAKGKKREHKKAVIDSKVVKELLGVQRYRQSLVAEASEVGLATGLAWTEVGGEVLLTEATTMKGKGHLTLTGKLGEVMQESAKAALSFVRSRSNEFGLGRDFHKLLDMHIHIPEGAIPKDGPSAGIALATTIISALAGVPVRRDVAMTGEITLRGKVLPIGGVKEKVLAAHRGGIKTVILPRDNERDLKDIPTSVLEDVKIVLVDTMDEVLDIAFEGPIRKKDREELVKEQRPPQIKEGDRPGVH
ncbi:MAG: endopeptidase La [Acidobacteria bacterium]|nr:endopeptidase La [Acidobacteriota bacterium]MCZ6768243.1 endopeptidase La [Acidobacteriota bacterium]MCZ6878717.1 endopeptidase La [Acidobacteriota bacterium]